MIFGNDTIYRQAQPAPVGTHGTVDWTGVPSIAIDGCDVQPGSSQENLANRDTTLIQWTVFAPAGSAVQATDRITWGGDVYAVDGEPKRWRGLGLDHDEILLKKWVG